MDTPVYIDIPLYTAYKKDSDSEYLDGSKYRYVLKFDKDYWPLTVFWSLTTYRMSGNIRKSDPVRRYLIHSPLFSGLSKDVDGGLTIYLQRESPGRDKESNWLPPPRGLFFIALRVYLPKQDPLIKRTDVLSLERSVNCP
jgi:hypothetical protein